MFLASASAADAASPAAKSTAETTPPNVVMILSDDQAWTDFGFMGHPEIRTPHLDRLAARSAVFPRGYVPSSLCRPSLATLISGQYPHQHGITGNDPPRGVDRNEMLRFIEKAPVLPKLLASRGYVSHQSGKWWEGSPSLAGFTAGMTHGDPSRGGRHGDLGLKIGREGMQPIFDFIDEADDKPFFVWYAPFLPHTPHNPPERLLEHYRQDGRPEDLAKYYAMCEWFDETCGQLLGHLEEKKLTDNTLVVFVTDNGWIQRTSDSAVPEGWKFRFAPRSKRSPNEGGVRTPIMLSWPGHIPPGTHDLPVSSIDLVPTVLEAAGVDAPDSMPGESLLGVASGTEQRGPQTVFGEIFAHDLADLDSPAASLQYRWCVTPRWKLILPAGPGESAELYDLTSDPHELASVSSLYPEIVRQLTGRIDAWWNPATAAGQ
ncbi:MAG: sulfatase [Planctomycetaceae bacterium]|nr:sulfatase [Planctomycetaceae bacterium]